MNKYVPGWLRHLVKVHGKGLWYYEMQVGPVVFQWLHDLDHPVKIGARGNIVRINRFHTWWDYFWWGVYVERHWDFDPAINWLKRTRAWIDEEWYWLWHK